mmetsp:Transcript_46981/g.112888  ORF Transcript_46981/g.112888 Transcript_46981/m.112888 type:complete len:122 (-) Transcript_46981:110-475(-)
MSKSLSFYTLRSAQNDALSLPVALAANAPVQGREVTVVQRWHLNPRNNMRLFSSVKKGDPHDKEYEQSMLGSSSCWAPARNSAGEWMEIDLGEVHRELQVQELCEEEDKRRESCCSREEVN